MLPSLFVMLPRKQSPSQKMAIEKEETSICGEDLKNIFKSIQLHFLNQYYFTVMRKYLSIPG